GRLGLSIRGRSLFPKQVAMIIARLPRRRGYDSRRFQSMPHIVAKPPRGEGGCNAETWVGGHPKCRSVLPSGGALVVSLKAGSVADLDVWQRGAARANHHENIQQRTPNGA